MVTFEGMLGETGPDGLRALEEPPLAFGDTAKIGAGQHSTALCHLRTTVTTSPGSKHRAGRHTGDSKPFGVRRATGCRGSKCDGPQEGLTSAAEPYSVGHDHKTQETARVGSEVEALCQPDRVEWVRRLPAPEYDRLMAPDGRYWHGHEVETRRSVRKQLLVPERSG